MVVEAACDDAACTAPATASANTAAARGTATLGCLIRDPRLIETLTSRFLRSPPEDACLLAGGPADRESTDAMPAVDFKHQRQVPDRGTCRPALEPRSTGSLRLCQLLSLNQGKIRCWGLSPPYVISARHGARAGTQAAVAASTVAADPRAVGAWRGQRHNVEQSLLSYAARMLAVRILGLSTTHRSRQAVDPPSVSFPT
jgi:hypothetical protein